MAAAVSRSVPSSARSGSARHGDSGTSQPSARHLEASLSPSNRMARDVGPMNVIPAASRRSTKAGSSDAKPQPGQTASRRLACKWASTWSWSQYALTPLPSARTREGGPRWTTSSHTRTKAVRSSASVAQAIASIASPCSRLYSRSARRNRMAASPRFRIAILRSSIWRGVVMGRTRPRLRGRPRQPCCCRRGSVRRVCEMCACGRA